MKWLYSPLRSTVFNLDHILITIWFRVLIRLNGNDHNQEGFFMATFRLLPSGKHQVIIRKKGCKPITKTFDKKRPAMKWAADTESDLSAGKYKDAVYEDSVLYSILAKKYYKEVTPTKESPRRDRSPYELTVEYFEGKTMDKITSQDVYSFIEKLDSRIGNNGKVGLAAATKKQYLTFIQNVYMWSNAFWNVTCENPVPTARFQAKKLRMLTEPPSRDRRLLKGEEKIILRPCGLSKKNPTKYMPLHEICMIALDTAMREGEIMAMNIKHIDFKKGKYHIQQSKTDFKTGEKGREILLSERVVKLLENKIPYFDGRFFPWKPNSVCQKFAKLAKDNNMVDIVFHDLRHEATSRLFEEGLAIHEVALMTGHKEWESLKRYTHLKIDKLSEKREELKRVANIKNIKD